MNKQLAKVCLLVKDYDEAITFYVDKLGFDVVEDTPLDESGKRWVIVSPEGASQTHLLFAKAQGTEQIAAVGNQAGGRVFLFLYTNDFWRDYYAYQKRGVEFVRGKPRDEAYGTVAVFRDLYGNLWDLIEPRPHVKTLFKAT